MSWRSLCKSEKALKSEKAPMSEPRAANRRNDTSTPPKTRDLRHRRCAWHLAIVTMADWACLTEVVLQRRSPTLQAAQPREGSFGARCLIKRPYRNQGVVSHRRPTTGCPNCGEAALQASP